MLLGSYALGIKSYSLLTFWACVPLPLPTCPVKASLVQSPLAMMWFWDVFVFPKSWWAAVIPGISSMFSRMMRWAPACFCSLHNFSFCRWCTTQFLEVRVKWSRMMRECWKKERWEVPTVSTPISFLNRDGQGRESQGEGKERIWGLQIFLCQ